MCIYIYIYIYVSGLGVRVVWKQFMKFPRIRGPPRKSALGKFLAEKLAVGLSFHPSE